MKQLNRQTSALRDLCLFKAAKKGNQSALVRLYGLTEIYWRKYYPTCFERFMDKRDWGSVAKEEFWSQWELFDPKRGVRFNTWMVRIVRNRLTNERIRLSAQKRGSGVEDVSMDDLNDSFMLIFSENNSMLVDAYYKAFEEYLIQKEDVDEKVLKVFHLKILHEKISKTKLAFLAGISVSHLERLLNIVKYHVHSFINNEAPGYVYEV